ncbi:aminotransferase [Rhizobium alvei]|uniref:Aminotransferase n=1 Tax=Rhizobium alvei TaxID=1132659 RepID=A0ABT8YFY6_9HYPH|nr:aminotransferase [Rhizobium alvei]MDO6962511.1 aminotransferase [Rhizobium alvei]
MSDHAALSRAELPRPDIAIEDAQRLARDLYGIEGDIRELGSQQDRNFLIECGRGRFVLKICRAEYDRAELEAQNAAMVRLAGRIGSLQVPTVGKTHAGAEIETTIVNGQSCHVRLLGYLEGEPLTRRRFLPEATVAALGAACARVARGLEDFRHPGLDRHLQWDLRHADKVAAHLLPGIASAETRGRIAKALELASKAVAPHLDGLRIQPIHHDITDDNVVARLDAEGVPIPVGIIDFGDLMNGWLVADLAVTCAALLHHSGGDPFFILPAVKAFHAVHPLTVSELKALWPLIVQRAAVLVASSELQLSLEPDHAYVLGNIDHERVIFEVASATPIAVMQAAILAAAGMEAEAAVVTADHRLFPEIDPARIAIARLDTLSPALKNGNWRTEGQARAILRDAVAETGMAATRYGERRLTETAGLSPDIPATTALFVELALPQSSIIAAPFAGALEATAKGLRLVGGDLALWLEGVTSGHAAGSRLEAGVEIGRVGETGLVTVQLCRDPAIDPLHFVKPHQFEAWSTLCPSPATILGFDCNAPASESEALLASRQAHFAKPQKNYYRRPPQIERGFREEMYDVDGRTYLDMVNNVTILGHGHPRLAEAVGRQWSLLNTNSRFHYAGVAEFSKRLADLAPEGLDTVFLVNSGSEANDLALRLAWAHSGARNMLCLLEAYHGWTVASDAVSTSIADNPQALTTRPSWVHAITSPNTFRGPFRGPDSAAGYIAAAEKALAAIDAKEEGLAGFICESVYGNSGGIPLPKGYLKEVYRMVRERGGVTIADEVQVGYGRLGHYFWGFDEQGVTPDIITIAKGMGNGHPLGAVITSRAIADSLEKEGYFFSSAGGSPVSCVVGQTVLDIMRDERLQDNARDIGDHLRSRLEALGQRFAIVGAVHGMGLYLGLEFVRDRQTLEPATIETARICDRLLDLGVIMQPTGDYLNVLKIKPPLCLSRAGADYFADMLARVLEEGY